MENRQEVEAFMRSVQDEICAGLEGEDGGARFAEDLWSHHSGGGGRSRVIAQGSVFEKGGVNFSAVEGELPSFLGPHITPGAKRFFATGVSIVIHPENPFVPIIHANIRYFESDQGDAWFGGGIDLTPVYVVEDQVRAFHGVLREVCDSYRSDAYARFKEAADDYFYIPHRGETRGVGGIFYDYLRPGEAGTFDELMQFTRSVGRAFLPAYLPLVREQKVKEWTAENKQWQLIRRGRYVEFNLVYDKGTRFGLETGGRVESILMSLPLHASWIYNHKPAAGSEEERSLALFRKGMNWIGG
ncbi:MAG: oxygen-dependent coproporphyrinogen oxidase [Flavobacteriales bacterium]|jgi:coproporphyrinogen III oxidase